MDPDPQYNAKLKSDEDTRLAKAVSSLSKEAKESAYREGLELQANQNSVQDLSSLPTVRMSDVPQIGLSSQLTKRSPAPPVAQFYTVQPTNGLTHFQGRITFDLPETLKIYLPLYTRALTWMGTANRDRLAYSNQMEAYTGGISFSPYVSFNPHGVSIASQLFSPRTESFTSSNSLINLVELNSFNTGISVASCSLNQHADKMIDLILDPLLNFNVKDLEQLHNLLRMSNSSMLGTLASSGHIFAMSYSASFFGPGLVSVRLPPPLKKKTKMKEAK